ncbi:hypothetical protein AMS68_002099 [Peltaster fructicola]|uniref:GST N-terminal domain-containing protein n=1 Tax=Peltaster fructicola TaxID=286661 RepID=A0A6H0XP94_9PEZI|nr:hypothetical protein AMS68_002099 [Peltaster fructicola]
MSPSIKLYMFPMSCSIASHALLKDSGLKFEAIKANVLDPAYRAEYLKNVNPKGQVPTLVIDNEIVTEAPAVLTAIAQLAPEKFYAGRPENTVRFLEWMNFLSGTLHTKNFTGLFRPAALTTDSAGEEGIRAKSKENVLANFELIEQKLKGVHALEDHLTGVDTYLVYFVLAAKKFGIWDEQRFPKYQKLFENIMQIPSFKATFKEHSKPVA